jgi:hypothetical protein
MGRRRWRRTRTIRLFRPTSSSCICGKPAWPRPCTSSSSVAIWRPRASERTGGRQGRWKFASRLGLVTRQLARSPYLAGDRLTAADISVTYALEFAREQTASSSARRSGPMWRATVDAKLTRGRWKHTGPPRHGPPPWPVVEGLRRSAGYEAKASSNLTLAKGALGADARAPLTRPRRGSWADGLG